MSSVFGSASGVLSLGCWRSGPLREVRRQGNELRLIVRKFQRLSCPPDANEALSLASGGVLGVRDMLDDELNDLLDNSLF